MIREVPRNTITFDTNCNFRVSETTVRFINLPEGPSELRKAIILVVRTYYTGRIQSKVCPGKKHIGQSLETLRCERAVVLSQWTLQKVCSFLPETPAAIPSEYC